MFGKEKPPKTPICKLKREPMKAISKWALVLAVCLTACSGPKSYFTQEIRTKIEAKSVTVEQIQFYVDRDVELRRELSSGNLQVSSGKVKFENGKYIHIILLKKGTPGVCVKSSDKSMDVSFEVGDGKTLLFSVPKNGKTDTYMICANEWANNYGKVTYDGQTYYIQPGGASAALMIKKSVVGRMEVRVHKMKGRKI
jgi:hypothetical protein